MRRPLLLLGVLACCLGATACRQNSNGKDPPPIVGVWFVKIPEAPFPYHMLAFHADGTLQQANPDAGNAHTSDSNGMGAWVMAGDRINGRFVEITADRATHQFVSRGDIRFSVKVAGDTLSGTVHATFTDIAGRAVREPVEATLAGQRVLP
jgi:hypothetical protein